MIVVLVIVLGLPLLVKLLLFMGDLRSANRPVDRNDLIPPGPPQLVMSYDATNSASQTIKGLAEPGATVFLTINANPAGNVVVTDDGEFLFRSINLYEGDNELNAVAVDPAGNRSQPSQSVNILFSTEVPKLEIESPADRQSFSGNPARLNIVGKTDPGVRLTVNDRVIIVDSSGSFSSTVNLNPGENTLIVRAKNETGNESRKELLVTYSP